MLDENKKIEDLMVGGLKIIQSDDLYKFTSDSVLLAKFPQKKFSKVLDLCAGSGVVGLHYLGEYGAEKVDFVEVQKPLADMCEESLKLNGLVDKCAVFNVNLKEFNGQGAYDVVFCNPPYKRADSGYLPENEHLAVCRAEVKCDFLDIVKCAYKALKHGGRFFACHKPERLTDVLTAMRTFGIEPTRLRFVAGKGKTDIYLFLIEGVKDKKPPFKVEGVFVNDAINFKG